MLSSQKIALRFSEVRQRLNEIAGLEGDVFADEIRTEADTLQAEFRDLAVRHRAAIIGEADEADRLAREFGEGLDAETRERLELRSKATVTGYVLANSAELTAGERRPVDEWQALHDREGAVIDAIGTLPERARRGRELPFDDADGADLDDPRIVAWWNDARELLRECRSMLANGAEYASHLDVMAGSRDAVETSIDRIAMEMRILNRAAFVWRVRDLERRADAGNTLPLDLAPWSGLLEDIRTLVDRDGLADAMVKDLAGRLEEDSRWRRDRDRVGALVGRLRRLGNDRPCFGFPDSPWSRSFPPATPPELPFPCSLPSSVLLPSLHHPVRHPHRIPPFICGLGTTAEAGCRSLRPLWKTYVRAWVLRHREARIRLTKTAYPVLPSANWTPSALRTSGFSLLNGPRPHARLSTLDHHPRE